MTTIFNQEALVSVEISDRERAPHWKWVPPRKSLWRNIPGRFELDWYVSDGRLYTKDELIRGEWEGIRFLIDGNVLYYRPWVRLTYVGNKGTFREFDSYEEALAWGEARAAEGIKVRLTVKLSSKS